MSSSAGAVIVDARGDMLARNEIVRTTVLSLHYSSFAGLIDPRHFPK
jgi:hypothetical protein